MKENLKSEDVIYKTADDSIKSYLTRPDAEKKHPGIILIHEIFGLDDHIRNVADRLAMQGYVVLAPHLFSSSKFSNILSQENIAAAMKFMMSIPVDKQRDENYRMQALESLKKEEREVVSRVNQVLFVNRPTDLFTEYLEYGVGYLKSLKTVGEKMGSVGFCFGGGMSINLGCGGKIDGCIIFYGENPNPIEKIANAKGYVMGLYGGEDHRINSGVGNLVNALVKYNKPFTIRVFPGAHHAFFNDTRPQTYNKLAAEEAWKMVVDFFESTLK